MVELSIWVDEFLYVLFDHIDQMDEENPNHGLGRSLSKIEEDEENDEYFQKAKAASGFVE